MRELAAAAVVLMALAIVALAPRVWPESEQSGALASGPPVPPQSWVGKDDGAGFVVCGSSDTWTRPGLAEQNAHLASEPRYARLRADDSYSEAWMPFRAGASFYDGSDLNTRVDLIALTGMWSDPHIAAVAAICTSKEPQIWLAGYTPATYFANDSVMAELRVVPTPGYRMVVLTGVIRRQLVVAGAMKLGVFQMPASAITSTPVPLPKPTVPATQTPRPYPMTDRPVDLILPSDCHIERSLRHDDGLGAAFTVQCGSAEANLSVSVAAMKQGWTHMGGPPIGVGIQTYLKGALSMQIAYRLDGPAYSAPFQLVQYSRPFAQDGEPSPPNPNAYVRVPTGFELPAGCVWREPPAGFTSDGAYKIPFACPTSAAPQIQAAFTRALQAQGWRIENGGFGFLSYAKDNLRLTAAFANEKAEPSETPWVVESLCCFGP